MTMSKTSPQQLAYRRIQAYRAKAVDDETPSAHPKKDCKKTKNFSIQRVSHTTRAILVKNKAGNCDSIVYYNCLLYIRGPYL